MCIPQMIKYLWKIIIYNFSAPQPLATTDYPSFGLLGCCRPMLETEAIMRVLW